MKTFLFIFIVMLTMLFCSRDKEDSEDLLYTTYFLYYDVQSNQTYAQAVFNYREEGGLYQLPEGSSVYFDEEMLEYNAYGSYYELVKEGLDSSGVFRYVDVNGKEYVNTIGPLSLVSYDEHLDTIDLEKNFSFYWNGDLVTENEELVLNVYKNGTLVEKFVKQHDDLDTLKAFFVGVNGLSGLDTGNHVTFLNRIKYQDLQQATPEGGIMICKYKCMADTVFVK